LRSGGFNGLLDVDETVLPLAAFADGEEDGEA
jgi:hypothetical protein